MNIFDVGARYGVHETWQDLFNKKLCNYYAFEPHNKEYKRLIKKYENEDLYQIENIAFGKERNDKCSLNIYKHHGYSSLLDINKNSDWFKRHVSTSELESVQDVKMETIDNYCKNKNIQCDFLKTDTEGYDLSVIEGSSNQLKNIIGIQC